MLLSLSSALAQGSRIDNGVYVNPIIHADYSDPDVIRVGEDYYLVSSSFGYVPGIPILHSKNLTDWSLVGYALTSLQPLDRYATVQPGKGVWAPSIRYHNGEFFIYYPDPDLGIFVTKASNIKGPWSSPILVQAGKGLIDPCPLWDSDGKAYLVHAYAGSRASIKSILVVKQLSQDGLKVLSEPILVYDGHSIDPTVEGPKIYKRNGYYYIFAPAGGVTNGWQIVLRSRNILGPYERKIVLEQGSTTINGPHQGAWVTTTAGDDWFIHFQDKYAYGRIVHLQPVKWINDWPIIGVPQDSSLVGNPVKSFKKPALAKAGVFAPQTTFIQAFTDEFNSNSLGLCWQWQANPQEGWYFMRPDSGLLRLNAQLYADSVFNPFWVPSVLTQMLPCEAFTATVKLNFSPRNEGDEVGLVLLGKDVAGIKIQKTSNGLQLLYSEILSADANTIFKQHIVSSINAGATYLRVNVYEAGLARFSFSTDGSRFIDVNTLFTLKPGIWVGARLGVYCSRKSKTNDTGYADIDWFHIEKNEK